MCSGCVERDLSRRYHHHECVLMMYSFQKREIISHCKPFFIQKIHFKLLKCFVSLLHGLKSMIFLHNINMMELTNFNYSKAMLF